MERQQNKGIVVIRYHFCIWHYMKIVLLNWPNIHWTNVTFTQFLSTHHAICVSACLFEIMIWGCVVYTELLLSTAALPLPSKHILALLLAFIYLLVCFFIYLQAFLSVSEVSLPISVTLHSAYNLNPQSSASTDRILCRHTVSCFSNSKKNGVWHKICNNQVDG